MSGNVSHKLVLGMTLVLMMASLCAAESARQAVRAGNELYAKKDWQGAISAYEKATADEPGAIVPEFNRANALFQSGDLAAANEAYKEVAAESRDLPIVARAKYNLGNCYFKEGMRQRDSDLQKSVDSLKEAIESWRGTLEIQPGNRNAAHNIEVARLTIKEIMDEIKKQQEQQKQDPNSAQQQNQQQNQQQQGDQQQQQQQSEQGQDPNDPNQAGRQQQKQEEKEEEKQEEQQSQAQQTQEKKEATDATAEQILREEQDRKRNVQPGGYVPVEQDW